MRRQTEPVTLGPDSVTWRLFGDWRNLLVTLWVGSMQNMHPGIGAAVEQHSRFFEERWSRVLRSFYPVLGVVYDGPQAADTAAKVVSYHHSLAGLDAAGRRYHALAPDTFYWAHAVFFMTMVRFGDRFMGGVTENERERLFTEHISWYRLYGLTMRPVPESWAAFQTYWDHMCADVLEDTPAAGYVLDLRELEPPRSLRWVPRPLWDRAWRLCARFLTWITTGLYDPVIRRRLGLAWTTRDERWHRRAGWLVHKAFTCLPRQHRYHPRARAGWRRTRGGAAGKHSP
ncbi:oxygenase MpaB family protein [Kitasatospora sp. NPDC052896]|uniref:oxygenase MpaB family protein n=1 Tax=Kitasatospora sp. NPDC052896 TaxID=3364061 RepID=UPI0037CAB9EF